MVYWLTGEIAEAITISKNKGAIFVVYIEGKDEKSTQLTKLLHTDEVSSKLGSESFVAIKLEANSVSHQQFSEIYKQTPVPSIYFIGKNGTPLEIITESQDSSSLSKSLDLICQKAGVAVPSTGPTASTSLINSEQSVSDSNKPSNVVCENGICTIVKENTPVEEEKEISKEEKVERAKKLLEQKKKEKRREEEEKERLKEIERRKMGQNVQQLKKWQEDQELKQLLEEREKEKREQQAARERVLAQIAQDKVERAARLSGSPSTSQAPAKTQTLPQQPRSLPNMARIQFKLPDGTTNTKDFPISDTLESVHSYIKENINLPFTSYALSTTFPRRQFTDEDRDKTLLDLELVPSSVILILPLSGGTISTSNTYNWLNIFWNLLTPLFTIYGYIRNFIFGTPDNSANIGENKRMADGPSDSRPQPKRRMGETTVIRRHGNIHGLANRDGDDDENNTWNGNSTQQM